MNLKGIILSKDFTEEVQTISEALRIPILEAIAEKGLYLGFEKERLGLLDLTEKPSMKLFLDFNKGRSGFRLSSAHKEDIHRAVGEVSQETFILDATMGFAEDSFLLSKLNCQLLAIEQNQIVYFLVKNAMDRCEKANFQIKYGSSLDWMQNNRKKADIIYLDPMFHRQDQKAKVKKEMQFLQKLNIDSDNGDALLYAALQSAKQKVIVKRHSHAKFLADISPNYSVEGKSIRFDVYTESSFN